MAVMIVSGSAKTRRPGRLALFWGLSMLLAGGYEANAGGMSAPGFTSGVPVYAKLPEGFYYLNQHSSGFRDIEGGDVRTNTNIFFLYYQSPWELAGGSLSFVLAPTLFEISTSPGERYAGFYNTYVGAQLSWPTGWEGLRVGYRISGYIPQGGEVAFDYGSIENRFGLTYGGNDWSVLANFIIGTPVGDGRGDVAPNYFLADFHVLRTSGKWTFGPVAHVSADLSEPHAAGYRRQSQVALGGLLGYDFGPLTFQAKLTRDVDERNYGDKETIVWTNIIVPLSVP